MEVITIGKSQEIYYTFPAHKHDCWEIIVNTFGSGQIIVDEKQYPFQEGTIFCIPPGIVHFKTAADGFTDACLFTKDIPLFKNNSIRIFEDDDNHSMRSLILMASDIYIKKMENYEGILNAIGNTIYQLFLSWNTNIKPQNKLIRSIQDELAKNISNYDFNVRRFLEGLGYSAHYLSSLFKNNTGYSPLQYFINIRIEHAKNQLQLYHDIYSIKEIALNSGFPDPYYFSRTFKKCTGQSPVHYIESLREHDLAIING
ncbi:MAG: helix-turn-helix domain-containing protein [Lachnospiraceae bacterium]